MNEESNREKIHSILSKREMEKSLEKMMLYHINNYTQRHLPHIESSYILNDSAIIKMVGHYESMFNENPTVQIYEMSFYVKGRK